MQDDLGVLGVFWKMNEKFKKVYLGGFLLNNDITYSLTSNSEAIKNQTVSEWITFDSV